MPHIYTPPPSVSHPPDLLAFRDTNEPTMYRYGDYEQACEEYLQKIVKVAKTHVPDHDGFERYIGSVLHINNPVSPEECAVYVLWAIAPLAFVHVPIRGGFRLPQKIEQKLTAAMAAQQEQQYEFLSD